MEEKPIMNETMNTPVALVTGGSRGIGRAIVHGLAKVGYFVEFTYQHSAALAEGLVAELGGERARAHCLPNENGVDSRELVRRIKAERGRLDLLICNAGIMKDA